MIKYTAILCAIMTGLSACGGGGSNPSPIAEVIDENTPTPPATGTDIAIDQSSVTFSPRQFGPTPEDVTATISWTDSEVSSVVLDFGSSLSLIHI